MTSFAHGREPWQLTGLAPNVTVAYRERIWVRVLNAAPTRALFIRVLPGTEASLSLVLIAIDGITLSAPVESPVELEGLPLTSNRSGAFGGLLLPSGGRFDLLLTVIDAPATGRSTVEGFAQPSLWHAEASCDDANPLGLSCPDSNPFPLLEVIVPKLQATPSPPADVRAPSVPPELVLKPPTRLRPIPDAEVVARRRFVISQDRMGPAAATPELVNRERDPLSMAGMGYYINNRTFDPGRVDVQDVVLGSAGLHDLWSA